MPSVQTIHPGLQHTLVGDLVLSNQFESLVGMNEFGVGRAAGIHLIAATQKVTTKTIETDVQENIGGRICFRVGTLQGSNTVLGNKMAYELPDVKGRAIWNCGNDFVEVQTPFLSEAMIEKEISTFTQEIAERLREFERGFRKASGAMKKRLVRRVLKQVLVTPEGLKMYMLMAGQEDIPNHQLKLVREESVGGNKTPLYALTKRAAGDDSKLSVLGSDIRKNGDSGRTRTCDLLLRRQLLYPAELPNRGVLE